MLLYSFLLVLCALQIQAQSFGPIKAGPMVTHADMRHVTIWLHMSKPSEVSIRYVPIDASATEKQSIVHKAESKNDYRLHIVLDSVEPGKRYAYSVIVNGQKQQIAHPLEFSIPPLWQWRSDPPSFSVALGSCFYVNEAQYDRPGKPYGTDFGILSGILGKKPDLMIWLGDNVYFREADWSSRIGIFRRYEHTRSIPELQPLLGSVHHYAIWDDHDYGPNDSDRGYVLKEDARDAFIQFWGNPTYGNAANEGVYTTFQWGDVQFYLLDNRYFRSPNKRVTGERTILGQEQKQWLIDNLASSNATFKVIAMGGQFINPLARFENYAIFKQERDELIDLIAKEGISGVVFLSGDRHYAELSELPTSESRMTYPLYDFTSSPLTSGTFSSATEQDKNPLSVPNTATYVHNFGMLEFSGAGSNRAISFVLYDKLGKELWRIKKTAEEIGFKKR